MMAREVMTADVVSVRPETPTPDVARLLLEKGISAVPVVDDRGGPIGMVSEGDLVGRNDSDREARRDWWLTLLAEGHPLNAEFLASLRTPQRTARDVMSGPVVTVGEDTDVGEIARLLSAYRIKRVPVVRDGRIVGIVSRADLLRALAPASTHAGVASTGGFLASALDGFDRRFVHRHLVDPPEPPSPPAGPDEPGLKVANFRHLVGDHEQRVAHHQEEARRDAAEQRRRAVAALIDHHVSEQGWRTFLHQARQAAEHGQPEYLLLRFPSQLCRDGGRAINANEPTWPASLRGEAAELYLRWERDLKPRGFQLAARVLEFPRGIPGDIGLFLVWGK